MFADPYLATVTIFAGNFAPRGWMFCQGQLINISTNDILFALLGTTYGGDGEQTFALPDLRGRMAIHPGQGMGSSTYALGQKGGSNSVTATANNLPPHSHLVNSLTGNPAASTNPGNKASPSGTVPAAIPNVQEYDSQGAATLLETQNTVNTPPAGNSASLTVGSPYLVMNYVICVEGIFPSRN